MQKIGKIHRAVSEKTALPTNQPTNRPIIANITDLIGSGWRRSHKKTWSMLQRDDVLKHLKKSNQDLF